MPVKNVENESTETFLGTNLPNLKNESKIVSFTFDIAKRPSTNQRLEELDPAPDFGHID